MSNWKKIWEQPNEGRASTGAADNPFLSKKPKKTPKAELHFLWRELVKSQRIHEMVKCLQHEKKKLKILHSNVEGNEDFLDFAAKNIHGKSISAPGTNEDRKSQSDDPANPHPTVEKDGTQAHTDSDNNSDQEREKRLSASTRPSKTRRSSAGSRSEQALTTPKTAITDQEFEDIIEMCEDKIEQKALREAYEEKKAREKYLHNASEKRVMLYDFINGRFFTYFMLLIIITSIIGIFLLTFETLAIRYAFPLIMLDSCIIGVFLVEAALKAYIYKDDYFKQPWNILDLVIIIVHLVEVFVDLITRTLALSTDINANMGFKFLKSLRALRLLRIIKFLPSLQVIAATVFQSMLSIGSIAVLMLLFIFVFAVMGRGLFYERSPQKFGNLWLSFVTLFQLLTLDDWFELLEETDTDVEEYEDNIEKRDEVLYWMLFGYLFAYLVMEFFVFLNLFVAVLVDNFQLTLADVEIQKQKEAMEELSAQQKFEDLKKEGVDSDLAAEDHLLHLTELEQMGLFVEDYFPINKDSKEAEILSEFFKNLNSLDFEKFLWRRRHTVFNMITDTALNSRQKESIFQSDSSSSSEEDDVPAKRKSIRYSRRASKRKTGDESIWRQIADVIAEGLPGRRSADEEAAKRKSKRNSKRRTMGDMNDSSMKKTSLVKEPSPKSSEYLREEETT